MSQGHSTGDGMYWIVPDGGSHSNAFLAYCDMTSYNGGWTMCYTTDEYAKPKTEVTYNTTFPYRTDGYRTNCNEIEVSSCIWCITSALPLTSRGTQWICSPGKFLWLGEYVLERKVLLGNRQFRVFEGIWCVESRIAGMCYSSATSSPRHHWRF